MGICSSKQPVFDAALFELKMENLVEGTVVRIVSDAEVAKKAFDGKAMAWHDAMEGMLGKEYTLPTHDEDAPLPPNCVLIFAPIPFPEQPVWGFPLEMIESIVRPAPPAGSSTDLILFNNGSGGDSDITFSFGGSHAPDFSAVTHGAAKYVLKKNEAKKVSAPVGAMFLATIPEMGGPLVACPVGAGHNIPWLRAAVLPFENSEQQTVCRDMETEEAAVAALKAL